MEKKITLNECCERHSNYTKQYIKYQNTKLKKIEFSFLL